jgi:glyoxylase-like metal-dependent hydrolase (beta-lactamase superfamily II)
MQELQAGLWFWTAEHPAWTPKDGGPGGWPHEVSSYALETAEWLVLIDPIAPPSGLEELAAGRKAAVVLTCPWHDRDSALLTERLGAPVYGPPREVGEQQVPGPVYGPGDTLPGGIVAYPALEPADLVLWIPEHRALVFGDTLIDRGRGLEIPVTWTPLKLSREKRAAVLRTLLELPVELVLPTHGPPTDRAALERALAADA